MDSSSLPDTVEQYIAKLQSCGQLQMSFKIIDDCDRKTVVLTWTNISVHGRGGQGQGQVNYAPKYKSPSQLNRDKLRRIKYKQSHKSEHDTQSSCGTKSAAC